MDKKRGLFVVVLVIIIFSALAIAEETTESPVIKKYNSLVKGVEEGDGGPYELDQDNTCGGPGAAKYQDLYYCNDDTWIGNTWAYSNDCDEGDWGDPSAPGVQSLPADKGCYIRGHESSDIGDEPCGWIKMEEGVIIKKDPSSGLVYQGSYDYGGDSEVEDEFFAKFYTPPDVSYVCGDDHFWYECDSETTSGAVVWAKDNLYTCNQTGTYEKGDYKYEWLYLDTDADADGYTKSNGDCKDNSEKEVSCPKAEIENLIGLTQNEIQDYIYSTYCSKVEYSTCAICINPGAAEVCGDKINNDCDRGTNSLNASDDDLTSDDCNKFKQGCLQEGIALIDNPEVLPEPSEEETSSEGSSSDEESSSEEKPIASTSLVHKNIYDQTFSWIPTEEGGYCCGYNGIDDSGLIKDGAEIETKLGTVESALGSYVCLNKDLTGSKDESIPDDLCGKDWCWVKASGPAKFQIFTVNLPTAEPFDLVSNSHKWSVCSAGSSPTLEQPFYEAQPEEGEESTVSYNKIANRFYCYQEGNHYSWAE